MSKTKNKAAAKSATPVAVADTSKPARPLSPFEEMDRMMENLFQRGWMRPFMRDTSHWGDLFASSDLKMPSVDVIDRENEVLVKAEVSGVNKDDLDVTVSDDNVTIEGRTSHEEKEEKGDYYRSEITKGSFARSVMLPCKVNGDKAKATFENGILQLTLPKAELSRRHSIKVT